MKGYCYNQNKEFTTLIDLRLDPMEWKVNKLEKWLVPANCTTIKPPFENLKEDQVLYFDVTNKKWDVREKKTLLPIYSVDVDGFLISTSTALLYNEEMSSQITLAPSKDLLRPKWDKTNKKWVEGKDPEEYRVELRDQVDVITVKKIFEGFVWPEEDGNVFSASLEAQQTISDMSFAILTNNVPDEGWVWNTLDDRKSVTIPKSKVTEFCTIAMQTRATIKQVGTDLKNQIRDMKTIEELKAFKDPRI